MRINIPSRFRTFFDRDSGEKSPVPNQELRRPPSPILYYEPSVYSRCYYGAELEEFEVEVVRLKQPKEVLTEAPTFGPERGSYTEAQYRYFEQKFEEYLRYIDLERTPTWEFDSEEKGMKLWIMKDPEYIMFRTEVELDMPLEAAVVYAKDLEFRKKLDKQAAKVEVVKYISEDIAAMLIHLKLPWPLSDREVFFYRHFFMADPDCFVALNFDVYDMLHENKGIVRIACDVMGGHFRRLSASKTLYTNFSRSNPKMKVPQFIMRSKARDMGKQALMFKELAEELERKRSKQ